MLDVGAADRFENFVAMDGIPNFDLGEPMFEGEDIQTHHTCYARGCRTVNAVGDPDLKEKKLKRKRMERGKGILGTEKKRRTFKKRVERLRGEGFEGENVGEVLL